MSDCMKRLALNNDILRQTRKTLAYGNLQQTFSALFWLDQLFNEFKPTNVLELGTGAGSLTVFFALYCPYHVITVDNVDRRTEHTKRLHELLGINTYIGNALEPKRVANWYTSSGSRTFVFCDNGNKPREFRIVAPLLRPGDIVGVHDNFTEFFADREPAQTIAKANNLVRWRRKDLDDDATMIAVWRKDSA